MLAGCTGTLTAPDSSKASPTSAAGASAASPPFPTLEDFWNGDAEFQVDRVDTGLPMGESDTVVLSDGRYRAYVHASDRSLGVVDSCGAPVPFPGCVVAFESVDGGHTFAPVRNGADLVTCMIPCRTCPCDSRRDHVDQQQYPRVVRVPPAGGGSGDRWVLVYEYRGSVFLRTSVDGLDWSPPAQAPQSGAWRTWLMPCRQEESVGPHPHTPDTYECLVGGPPGIAVSDEGTGLEMVVFVGLGQNPGSMGCYRGEFGADASLLRKCDANPLFTGAPEYGIETGADAQGNPFFDFRTISSARRSAGG